jgi:ribonuclease HII
MRKFTTIALAIVTLAACSGSKASTTTASSDAALKTSVAAYTAAFAAGDGAKAWAMVSPTCQTKIAQATYDATVKSTPAKYPGITATNIVAKVTNDTALVSYEVGGGLPAYVAQRWANVAGAWHWDGC